MALVTIHVAGSLNIDEVFETSHIVAPGETIPSTSYQRFPGGKGLNQSLALARAGAAVRHVALVGPDGEFLRELLKADGVDVSDILDTLTPTGRALIQVGADGENAIVLFGGANRVWGDTQLERLGSALSPGDVVLVQNETNLTAEIISRAARTGALIAFNPAPMTDDVRSIDPEAIRWLIVNEGEGRHLADASVADDEDLARALARRFPKAAVALTLGERGAIRCEGGLIDHARVDASGPIVDTTGAGDVFAGYWIDGESRGIDPAEALRRACAAAAISVTRPGAASSIPWAEEVDRYLAGLG